MVKINNFGALVVESADSRTVEFEFRDKEFWIFIEGTGYDNDNGSITTVGVEDTKELIAYLQKVLPA